MSARDDISDLMNRADDKVSGAGKFINLTVGFHNALIYTVLKLIIQDQNFV